MVLQHIVLILFTESDTAEDAEAKETKRQNRELKMLNNKLKMYRDKHQRAQKERTQLRVDVKQQQRLLKEEKKKYKVRLAWKFLFAQNQSFLNR